MFSWKSSSSEEIFLKELVWFFHMRSIYFGFLKLVNFGELQNLPDIFLVEVTSKLHAPTFDATILCVKTFKTW